MSDPDRAAPSTRIVVTRGTPTDEELAAIVIALTPVAVDEPAEAGGPTGWQRAAMLESRGLRLVSDRGDLTVPGIG